MGEHALDAVRLVAPIPHPPSIRDFYAFERHAANARAQRGLEMAPEWYRIPVFYFSNPAAVSGPEDEVVFPAESSAWDYELEAAAVIGAEGRIAGFTVLNDWSARDLQKMEMAVGLGPAKGKDFATTLGPVVVTPDELGDLGLEMLARVNGEERSRGNLGDLHWPWEELVAHAARNTRLVPGRHPRLGDRRDRLHPRARRRALAPAGRRGRARDRGDRGAAEPRRGRSAIVTVSARSRAPHARFSALG